MNLFFIRPVSAAEYNALKAGIFLDILKRAEITHIFQSGYHLNNSINRPISVLPLFSKFLSDVRLLG